MYIFDALARHSKHMNAFNKHTMQQPEYNAARARLESLLIDVANPNINVLVTVIDITFIQTPNDSYIQDETIQIKSGTTLCDDQQQWTEITYCGSIPGLN